MSFLTALAQPICSSPWTSLPNVSIIRGDLIHPIVSGNKLYKLLPAIERAIEQSASHLISVGGRYSNHLHALAWVGHQLNIPTVALVSGFAEQAETATLKDCRAWGMDIHFVSRSRYQQRYQAEFWQPWQHKFPNAQVIYEGGWSPADLKSSGLWWQSIASEIEVVVCAVGSGSMLAGLLLTKPKGVSVIGVPAFRDPDEYAALREKLISAGVAETDIQLWSGFAGRGFGKLTDDEAAFMNKFEREQELLLDPVYTVKAFYALEQMLTKHPDLNRKKIAVIHSGGLQGRR